MLEKSIQVKKIKPNLKTVLRIVGNPLLDLNSNMLARSRRLYTVKGDPTHLENWLFVAPPPPENNTDTEKSGPPDYARMLVLQPL